MDLSYRFDRNVIDRAAVTAIPTELAILMVGVAARQATSRTARLQYDLDAPRPAGSLLAPADGAFNGAVERALADRPAPSGTASPDAALTPWQPR